MMLLAPVPCTNRLLPLELVTFTFVTGNLQNHHSPITQQSVDLAVNHHFNRHYTAVRLGCSCTQVRNGRITRYNLRTRAHGYVAEV